MPQLHGEASLLTLYADVHYYFSHSSAKPPHHRFDKGSYVYLYHNPAQRRARMEVANAAGTPDQDAFMGYLDSVTVNRTFKQPALITITVDPSYAGSAHSTPQQDYTQWHLPAADQRNEGKYMFKIHTLDIYFWTETDATLFSDTLQKCLEPHQVRVLDAPTPKNRHSEHSDTMSPVVQKLEHLAVTKGYHQPRSNSVSTTQSFAGPPTTAAHHMSLEPLQDSEPPYAPIAPYNPAAPAAPEPIAHREKTPPPPDAESGTGLVEAAAHDQGTQHGPPQIQQQHSYHAQNHQRQPSIPQTNATGSFPPPPVQNTHAASPYGMSFASPPAQAGASPYAQTTSPHTDIQRHPSSHTSYSNYSAQSSQPTSPSQYRNYASSPGYPHPPAPIQSPGHSQAAHPARVQSPGVTIQGYSNYSYHQNQAPAAPYGIHSQAYRPTELEANAHGSKHRSASNTAAQAGPGVPGPGKFEHGMTKVEKGVNRLFKKLDKTL